MKLLIAILAIIGSYLIGRYYKSVKAKELKSANDAADYWQGKHKQLWYEKSELHQKYDMEVSQVGKQRARADQYYAELQSLKLKNQVDNIKTNQQ